jgi:hypothetical protein
MSATPMTCKFPPNQWSIAETDLLKQLYHEGESIREIRKVLWRFELIDVAEKIERLLAQHRITPRASDAS